MKSKSQFFRLVYFVLSLFFFSCDSNAFDFSGMEGMELQLFNEINSYRTSFSNNPAYRTDQAIYEQAKRYAIKMAEKRRTLNEPTDQRKSAIRKSITFGNYGEIEMKIGFQFQINPASHAFENIKRSYSRYMISDSYNACAVGAMQDQQGNTYFSVIFIEAL
ncbi:CAP domain-containing protein [Sediminitomix flava]|uniref:SCP domain-containing protein n=1 Tax=Sediminitomix flava TaxID=379075 RepID=A0A315ZH59_SEDFL|nr:hypothetical protein [Sediminitomix flava]PWJ44513.1 hypothetical protein BC781_101884 [Sediminitomix flava]